MLQERLQPRNVNACTRKKVARYASQCHPAHACTDVCTQCSSRSQQAWAQAHHRAAHCRLVPIARRPHRQQQPLLGADMCGWRGFYCRINTGRYLLSPEPVHVPVGWNCASRMSQPAALLPMDIPLPPCLMAVELNEAASLALYPRVHGSPTWCGNMHSTSLQSMSSITNT